MPTVFVLEYLTGGGLLDSAAGGLNSLKAEGAMMLVAVAADFARIPQFDVVVLRDHRFDDLTLSGVRMVDVTSSAEFRLAFRSEVAASDAVLLIAPESENVLLDLANRAAELGGRLLSPSPDLIRVASDKRLTRQVFARHDIPHPDAVELDVESDGTVCLPRSFDYPAVVKPADGVGGERIRYVEQGGTVSVAHGTRWLLEAWQPGIAASIGVLASGNEVRLMPPFRQDIAPPEFKYRGGSPLEGPQLIARARKLGIRTADALDAASGYFGIDFVLGEDPSGHDDVILEINPRLTSSYVGVRELTDDNLAEAMWQAANGELLPLRFHRGGGRFTVG